MPALPWIRTSSAPPGAELVVLATTLPLRSYRHIPGFLRWTWRIRGQLAEADGLVGYSLDARPLRKTFWTVSAWTSGAAMEAFVRQNPHAAAMAVIRPHMGRSAFVRWTVTTDDLPLRWGNVRRRIEDKRRATN